MSRPPLRVAILAHSTNPRGGVVHALALGDALTRVGHTAVVYAPDASGRGFFRPTLCGTVAVPASPSGTDMVAMVETRVADYVRYFEPAASRRFDVFHAQDGLSGNALATLRAGGLIDRFARTVHHVDSFEDPRLEALQRRAITAASELFVVSPLWREVLAADFGRPATVVGNGVDRERHRPAPDGREGALRRRLDLGAGPVFLAIGGIEERKNTIRLVEAFAQVQRLHPAAQLIIAGGSSLLDHTDFQARFSQVLERAALPSQAIVLAGPVADADMPALFRIADALAFPSVREGFGLVVLEAMASGLPVVTSRIEPFTGYLDERDAVWCDPLRVASISDALMMVLSPECRADLRRRGLAVAARHEWADTAAAHLPAYVALGVRQHA